MNAPLDLRMDKKTFLQWVQTQEGRYELVGGRVVMQDTGSRDHKDVELAFYDVLRPRLSRREWDLSVGNLSVEIGEETRIADVMVEPAGLPRKLNVTDQPVLLVEVLSPSSMDADFNAKRRLYFTLPSLEIYIVASQDEPRIWIWQRSRDGARTFPDTPVETSDLAEPINLAQFSITVTLGEIYRDIFPA